MTCKNLNAPKVQFSEMQGQKENKTAEGRFAAEWPITQYTFKINAIWIYCRISMSYNTANIKEWIGFNAEFQWLITHTHTFDPWHSDVLVNLKGIL